ncbi:MAG: tRNA (adenosine(37)-N6)-threonylcarbamoyltransferase complex dimerization subunit type 1 TsaB [Mogibacterium sp.]|nr:tRNA (adenosine(37)-N6)-threonylcarbamoyltransferase complex dimerization subunit type 1 TsaB [Mogibacterium sp.]
MKILAIETTGKYGSAALIDDEGRLFSSETHDGNDHLREIIGTADRTLKEAGCEKGDLTHVAASIGPGSFTGIRIGVTAARTLSQMLDIPCIGVSSLMAMALRALEPATTHKSNIIAAIINARRHQVYAGAWKISDGRTESFLEERQYMIEELLDLLKDEGTVYFVGDGIDAYENIISEARENYSFALAPEEMRYQHASTVAGLALAMAMAGKTLGYDELMPEYMRLAEAEQRLKEGSLSDKISRLTTI